MDKYFSEEFNKILKKLFKNGGYKIIDVTIHNNGTVITSPRREKNSKKEVKPNSSHK